MEKEEYLTTQIVQTFPHGNVILIEKGELQLLDIEKKTIELKIAYTKAYKDNKTKSRNRESLKRSKPGNIEITSFTEIPIREWKKVESEAIEIMLRQAQLLRYEQMAKVIFENEKEFYFIKWRLRVEFDEFRHWISVQYCNQPIHVIFENMNNDSIVREFNMFYAESRYKREQAQQIYYDTLRNTNFSSLIKISAEIGNSVKSNLFNSMPLDQVEAWFMKLATNTSKNGRPHLSEAEVNQFINQAFCKKSQVQKLTINIANGELMSVTKLFYLYYDSCSNNYGYEPTRKCRKKYIDLIVDNFTNFDRFTLLQNFNNSKRASKTWS
ncbi:hypothetical protein GCM10027299_52590 [Larkinella ripae]